MAISRMKPENQVKLLRDAAVKVRTTRIPHIISEDQWVSRPANEIRDIRYEGELSFKPGWNFVSAKRALLREDGFLKEWLERSGHNRLGRLKIRVGSALYTLGRVEHNLPDAQVDGNLVHWSEHSIHIALWSPVVADAVHDMLLAEAKRIEQAAERGDKAETTKELMDLAHALINKQVRDNTPSRFTTPSRIELMEKELYYVLNELFKSRKRATGSFAKISRELYKEMRDREEPLMAEASLLIGNINRRYGYLSPKAARTALERQWHTAFANHSKVSSAEEKAYWQMSLEVVARFMNNLV